MNAHLDWFKRDGHGIHFRIRRDRDYWNAVRQVLKRLGRAARYDQNTHSFTVPFTSRTTVQLANIFPEDWRIVQESDRDEIDFT